MNFRHEDDKRFWQSCVIAILGGKAAKGVFHWQSEKTEEVSKDVETALVAADAALIGYQTRVTQSNSGGTRGSGEIPDRTEG